MFKTIQIIVMAMLCLNFSAKAQSEPTSSFSSPTKSAIRIGDIIPDYFNKIEHQAVQAKSVIPFTLTLDKYKNKLIILDFWATWCAACVYSIQKIDSIQRTMNSNEFVVIPVTYQSARIVREFLKNQDMQMPSIILDTTLKAFFPHQGIPHQVWIKNGKVIAIPKWQYATAENISKAIKREPLQMIMYIQDGIIDPQKPMFVKGNGDTGKSLYARSPHSVIARRLPGFQQHKLIQTQHRDTTVLYAYNLPITPLLYSAFEPEIYPQLNWKEGSGIYWEISDKLRTKFFGGPKESKGADYQQDQLAEKWRDSNLYGYNLRYPETISKAEALKIMQTDLNSFFGTYLNLKIAIENRLKPVLVLRILKDKRMTEKLLATKGGSPSVDYGEKDSLYKLTNAPISSLAGWLKRIHPGVVLMDKTGLDALKIDIKLPRAMTDNTRSTNQELAKYGLSLQTEDTLLPVLVVREGRGR